MGWRECFKYNTSLEKRLIIFIALLSVAIFILFVCLLASAHEAEVCNTPECVRAATHILDTVDPSVDPCDNFYRFACGTFLKNAFSLGQPTTLHYLKGLMKNQVKEIVIETNDTQNISRTLLMQRKFYRACMNEKAIVNDSNATFLKLLDDLLGGWPVVKPYTWPDRKFSWVETMIKGRNLGLFYEFYFRVEIVSGDNSSSNMLWIRPPSGTSISTFHWNEENIESMAEIASDLGANSVDTPTHLRRTLSFAQQLDEIAEKHNNVTTERDVDEVKKVAIKKLDNMYIKIEWFDFLRNITGLHLKKDDLVVFDVDDYFRDLYYLLMKTPKKIQANYMAWAVTSTNINLMQESIREKYRKILKFANDTDADLSRSDVCYRTSAGLFKNVAEGEYIRRYTPPGKKDAIRNIISDIKQELKRALQDNTWMDRETKDSAVQDLEDFSESIGWTDIVYDAKKFERFFGYNHVKITSDKIINMARELAVHAVNRYYRRITYSSRDEIEEFLNTPKLEVNAFYLDYFHKLILPTPILQGLIFDEKRPHYMNYGSLGSIIGHEFAHGFIDVNSIGGYNNTSWSEKTTENFKTIAECVKSEHDLYRRQPNGFHNNGSVMVENLADYTGTNLAYTAYQNWAKRNRLENLPGVKFTPDQIFWIMSSTYLCYEPKLAEADGKRKDTKHAEPSFRAIGRLRSSPYFAKDFNCPIGSKMHPEKKCRIFA